MSNRRAGFGAVFAVVAGTALALSGCATIRSAVQSVRPPVQLITPKSRTLLLGKVPFYPQTEYQCGPAALAGVLRASGINTSPQALTPQIYLPERKGSLQAELMAAMRRAGRIPYAVEGTPQALVAELAANRPVLVLQNLLVRTVPKWHYAVLVGADPKRNQMILNTGTHRQRRVAASKFLRTWDWGGRWGIVALRPGQLPARVDAGTYLTAVADFEAVQGGAAAGPAYFAAMRRWPRDARVQLALGNQAHGAGDRLKAVRHYRTGLAFKPGDAVLGNNLASVLGELGCGPEARAVLEGLPTDPRWDERLAATRAELLTQDVARSSVCDRIR